MIDRNDHPPCQSIVVIETDCGSSEQRRELRERCFPHLLVPTPFLGRLKPDVTETHCRSTKVAIETDLYKTIGSVGNIALPPAEVQLVAPHNEIGALDVLINTAQAEPIKAESGCCLRRCDQKMRVVARHAEPRFLVLRNR